MELERKFAPLTAKVCAAAPATAEEGERLLMLGAAFEVGGGVELPPPPPPHERQNAKAIVDRMQTTAFRPANVSCKDLCPPLPCRVTASELDDCSFHPLDLPVSKLSITARTAINPACSIVGG